MKRNKNIIGIILIATLVLTLSGCKKKKVDDVKEPVLNPTDVTQDVVESEGNREKIMNEFATILKAKELDKIVKYVDDNIGKLTTIEGDKMVLELESALEDSLDPWTETYLHLSESEFKELMELKGDELFFFEEKVKDIKDEKLREEVSKLFENKFKLINVEGQFMPIIDYEAFKKYNKNVSDEIKDYISIMANISNEPMAVDGGLRISFDELSARIIDVEKYIQKYSEGQKYEYMLGMYRTWLGLYLEGLPNTPIADFYTKEVHEEVIKSYINTANVKDSVTAYVIGKYINVIDNNKGIVNQDVTDKALSLVNEAISLLETSK